MKTLVAIVGTFLALTAICEFFGPVKSVSAAPRHAETAQQCVQRREFAAGYYNTPGTLAQSYAPYPFSRFYNTCNETITLMITTDGYGNNGPGATGPGSFMVMNWQDGISKATHTFACVYPGEPVKVGSGFVNPPTFGDGSYECLIP